MVPHRSIHFSNQQNGTLWQPTQHVLRGILFLLKGDQIREFRKIDSRQFRRKDADHVQHVVCIDEEWHVRGLQWLGPLEHPIAAEGSTFRKACRDQAPARVVATSRSEIRVAVGDDGRLPDR